MKKLLVLFLVIALLPSLAFADVISIDTDTATDGELQAAIHDLTLALRSRQPKNDFTPIEWSGNGYNLTIDGFEVKTAETDLGLAKEIKAGDKVLTLFCLFSHDQSEPKMFVTNVRVELYQNGLECRMTLGTDLSDRTNDNVLAGTEIPVIIAFKLQDDTSPITGFLSSGFSGGKQEFSFSIAE